MSTHLVQTIDETRAALSPARRRGAVIGLVPTMGALHRGHGQLIEDGRRGSDVLVVSLFVNPIQFNRPDDFDRYPRDPAADLDFCRQRGVDFVFAPGTAEMYPQPPRTFVDVEQVTEHLCGRSRPGHFRGMATVVVKLFEIVQPDRAWFGEKDAQQLAVIRRLVRDLNMPVEVIEVPTVREADGLALSSRNQHLTPQERDIAPALYRALCQAAEAVGQGATEASAVTGRVREALERQPPIRIEYVEIVDPVDMQPVHRISGPVRLAAAIWLGATRLIDNLLCVPSEQPREES